MPFPDHVRTTDFTFDSYPRWGDIYWYDFGMPRALQHTMAEPHLAIIISDTAATLKGTVLVCPLSGAEHRRPGYLFHVLLSRADCADLDKDTIVKVDQIYCVPVRPGLPDQYYVTRLGKRSMARVYEPLLRALGVNYLVGA